MLTQKLFRFMSRVSREVCLYPLKGFGRWLLMPPRGAGLALPQFLLAIFISGAFLDDGSLRLNKPGHRVDVG
jgi:hypothetical protein